MGLRLWPVAPGGTCCYRRPRHSSEKILSFDCGAAKQFSILAGMRRSLGRPISQFDAQIAAIVHRSRGTLITRNTQDFEGCQIRLVNPWETEDPA